MTTVTATAEGPVVVPETTSQRIVRASGNARLHRPDLPRPALARPHARSAADVARRSGRDRVGRVVGDLLEAEPGDARQLRRHPPQRGDHVGDLDDRLDLPRSDAIIPIIVAALAGYAFAWLEFPGRDWLFIAVVALLVVPIQMALIPIFSLYNDLGLFDTSSDRPLPHRVRASVRDLPARSFFIGIPSDLIEAAHRRRLGDRIFARVILPLGLPAIASLAIFQFLWVWNDLLVALTFGQETQPITVAIFSSCAHSGRTSS